MILVLGKTWYELKKYKKMIRIHPDDEGDETWFVFCLLWNVIIDSQTDFSSVSLLSSFFSTKFDVPFFFFFINLHFRPLGLG